MEKLFGEIKRVCVCVRCCCCRCRCFYYYCCCCCCYNRLFSLFYRCWFLFVYLFHFSFRWIVVHKLCKQQCNGIFVEFILSSTMPLDPRLESWSSIIHWGKLTSGYWRSLSLISETTTITSQIYIIYRCCIFRYAWCINCTHKTFKSVDWIFSFKFTY